MSPRPRIGRWLAPALAALALAVTASVPAAPTPVASSAVVVLARATAAAAAFAHQPLPARAAVVAADRTAVAGIAGKSVPASPPPTARPQAAPSQHDARPTKPKPKPVRAAPPRPAPAPSYHGTNHVWIPSLGINRSVSSFACSRTRPPDNYVYRWGCAGSNNVYLMGHAYGVFKALNAAYTSGRLHKGMQVIYADSGGHVRTYVVSFWRLASPVGSSWAYAAQSRPSMTLQTCVGSTSQWRLIVRLVAA
jgi:hypothetical protein